MSYEIEKISNERTKERISNIKEKKEWMDLGG
jgi:hypothetical protein